MGGIFQGITLDCLEEEGEDVFARLALLLPSAILGLCPLPIVRCRALT